MTSDREITLQLDYPQNLILAVVQNSDIIPPKKFTDDNDKCSVYTVPGCRCYDGTLFPYRIY